MLNWLFLDMDSYFAAVEQQARPELRGRPVGVVPVAPEAARGTCCIAVSREAKRFGVKTGTGVPEALARCPAITFVEARPAYYVQVHKAICEAVERAAPITKVYSIDEMAIRLVGKEREPAEARALAGRIKHVLREAVGEYLTCSIGLAATRLLAKTACEMGKPDGLVALATEDLPGAIAGLGLTDLPGINKGIAARLRRRCVMTVEDLWALTPEQAQRAWGSVEGTRYWYALHGIDVPEPRTHRRCFGHANVLAPPLRTEAGAHAMMTRLLHKAAARLRYHGYYAHTLSVGIRYRGGRGWQDAIDLPACQDTLTVIEHFERLWARPGPRKGPGCVGFHAEPLQVTVTLSGLTAAAATPGSLFEGAKRRHDLGDIMDRINLKFGGHSLYLGGMHDVARLAMADKIAFGRLPDESIAM